MPDTHCRYCRMKLYHIDTFSDDPLANTGELWLPHKSRAIETARNFVRDLGCHWATVTLYTINLKLPPQKLILSLLNRRGFFLNCAEVFRVDAHAPRKGSAG